MIHTQTAKRSVLLAPQTVTDGATVTANLDTKGHDYAEILISFAAEETTHASNSTISLLSSDDTVVSNFATIVANRSEDIANAHLVTYLVDTKSAKRYLRLSFTAGTTTGGNITLNAQSALYRSEQAPSGTADMLGSTNDAVVLV